MDKYHTIKEKGSFEFRGANMYIRLYPNSEAQDGNTESGSLINGGLINACDQLLDASSIDYYHIKRFHAEKSGYKYPKVDTSGNIRNQFVEDYLKNGGDNGNGTGENLYSLIGDHLLVHGSTCDLGTAGGEANSDDCDTLAFDQGLASWTGTCDSWELRQSSAIQEVLHHFLDYSDSNLTALTFDCSNGQDREHYLGKRVKSTDNITPMLTYHGGNYEDYPTCGDCQAKDKTQALYTQDLTWCTESAVDSSSQC